MFTVLHIYSSLQKYSVWTLVNQRNKVVEFPYLRTLQEGQLFLSISEHLYRNLIMTHWKRPWCWEGSGAGAEGDDRGWDGWMASLTRWTWVWVNSGSWWWTGRPGVLRLWGRKESDMTEWLNWTELNWVQKKNLKQLINCYSFKAINN